MKRTIKQIGALLLMPAVLILCLASCNNGSDPGNRTVSLPAADNGGHNNPNFEADDPTATHGLEYALNDDGASYRVTGIGTATDLDVVIPSTYNGLPVTSIKTYAFFDCDDLTSVTISEGVTDIGKSAFSLCKSLVDVTLPNSLTSIGMYAFENCGLTSILIPENVTSIGKVAFRDCRSLASIQVASGNSVYHASGNCLIETASNALIVGCKSSVIPTDGSVTSIGDHAFNGCKSLASITIPDCVTSIGDWAFSECESLVSITIPDGVTSIGSLAFDCCENLADITIPDSVTSFGNSIFSNCRNLVYTIDHNGKYLGNTSNPYICLIGVVDTKITDFTIPSTTKVIYDAAFFGCSNLMGITIPDSVISIDDYAFFGCKSLAHISIPDSVTSIGMAAFYGCSSLTSILIPDGMTSIGEWAFDGCNKLTINCDLPEQPSGWNTYRNPDDRPVNWGYTFAG